LLSSLASSFLLKNPRFLIFSHSSLRLSEPNGLHGEDALPRPSLSAMHAEIKSKSFKINNMAIIKQKFDIGGMHCGACAAGIQMYLSNTDGVKNAFVDYDKKVGEFEYDDEKIKAEAIVKAVEEVGYTAKPAAN